MFKQRPAGPSSAHGSRLLKGCQSRLSPDQLMLEAAQGCTSCCELLNKDLAHPGFADVRRHSMVRILRGKWRSCLLSQTAQAGART